MGVSRGDDRRPAPRRAALTGGREGPGYDPRMTALRMAIPRAQIHPEAVPRGKPGSPTVAARASWVLTMLLAVAAVAGCGQPAPSASGSPAAENSTPGGTVRPRVAL